MGPDRQRTRTRIQESFLKNQLERLTSTRECENPDSDSDSELQRLKDMISIRMNIGSTNERIRSPRYRLMWRKLPTTETHTRMATLISTLKTDERDAIDAWISWADLMDLSAWDMELGSTHVLISVLPVRFISPVAAISGLDGVHVFSSTGPKMGTCSLFRRQRSNKVE